MEFPMQFPRELFKRAGLTPSDVAALCEVSRVTGWRWMRGSEDGSDVGVNIFLHDRVGRVVENVESTLAGGALPDVSLVNTPPADRLVKIKAILRQNRPSK